MSGIFITFRSWSVNFSSFFIFSHEQVDFIEPNLTEVLLMW